MRRVEEARDSDTLALLRAAVSDWGLVTPGAQMVIFLFDEEALADAAVRGLKAASAGSDAQVWKEPALTTAMNERDGWCACWYQSITAHHHAEPVRNSGET